MTRLLTLKGQILKSCIICESRRISIEEVISRNETSILIHKCKSCGHWWQGKENNIDIYSSGTYASEYREISENFILNNKQISYERYSFYKNYFSNISNALEIGSSLGSFINILRKNNVDAVGIEPDPVTCNLSRELYGFEQINSSIENYESERIYERIFSFHVLEHVEDPHSYLTILKQKLSLDGGKVLIECPSLEIHKHGNMKRMIWEPHLHYYNLFSLFVLVSSFLSVEKIGFFKSSLYVIASNSDQNKLSNIIFRLKLIIISKSIFYFYRSKDWFRTQIWVKIRS